MCMYIYIYIYTYVYYIYIYAHIYTHPNTCLYMYTCIQDTHLDNMIYSDSGARLGQEPPEQGAAFNVIHYSYYTQNTTCQHVYIINITHVYVEQLMIFCRRRAIASGILKSIITTSYYSVLQPEALQARGGGGLLRRGPRQHGVTTDT